MELTLEVSLDLTLCLLPWRSEVQLSFLIKDWMVLEDK